MESLGNFFDEEWNNLSRMLVNDEGSDQFSKHGLIPSQYDLDLNFEILPNLFFHANDVSNNVDSFVDVSDDINPNFYQFFSKENSIISCSEVTNNTISCSYPCNIDPTSNDVRDRSMEYCIMDEINHPLLASQDFSHEGVYMAHDAFVDKGRMTKSLVSGRKNPLKRKIEKSDLPLEMDDEDNAKTYMNSKKRVRVAKVINKNMKNIQERRKNTKMNDTEKENNNNNREKNGQSSSSCSSNDDLNGSHEPKEASDSNEKTRASRGTATDPQSLYARKRREKINERLRILQNLVPNGTKVDISTMLEEAVGYVKFLKLQIQLLSSDDTWMYAPIAYNGMDMGLYQNIKPSSERI